MRQTATSAEAASVRAAVAQAEAQNSQIALDNARLDSDRRAAAAEVSGAKSRLALAEPPTQAVGRVQADAATAEDDDARHLAGLALRRGRGDRAARRRRGGGRVDDGVGC